MKYEADFVPFLLAVRMKEIDFDEPCFACWLRSANGFFRISMYPNEITIDEKTLAPTYQQAFRWFRENHNVQSYIKYNKSDHVWYSFHITFEVLADGENPPVSMKHEIDSWLGLNNEYKTYEEAELGCLLRCLSIVKHQLNKKP